MTSNLTAIAGTFMHTPRAGVSEILENALMTIDDGVIASITRSDDPNYQAAINQARNEAGFFAAGQSQCILPGLVDTHIHAPQWPQLGKALHLPLQDWLQANTFPLEAKFADVEFARHVYDDLVRSLLAHGTTTAVYFATIHSPATKVLVDLCLEHGQRALVGRVAMDHDEQCPDYYCDADADSALTDVEAMIDYTRLCAGRERLVQPVITPRFIPACTDALLEGLGALADTTGCHVKTHCSESDWEHEFVKQRLGKSDTEALNDFGLLTRHTILAHSNFIGDSDQTLIKKMQSGIAHCPLSNVYFANSVFPLKLALDKGLHVGLGTDISGGPSASMFDACRAAVSGSRILNDGADPQIAADKRGRGDARIDFDLAFWVATAGGGQLLDLPIGVFEPGYRFDAMLIDYGRDDSPIRIFDQLDAPADVFQKIVYTAERQDVRTVWVNGKRVVNK